MAGTLAALAQLDWSRAVSGERAQAHLSCRAICVDFPEAGRYLIVEVSGDCPACGTFGFRLAGHHLRAVRDFLIETIDAYPELTGKDGDYRVIDRLRASGTPNDPEGS